MFLFCSRLSEGHLRVNIKGNFSIVIWSDGIRVSFGGVLVFCLGDNNGNYIFGLRFSRSLSIKNENSIMGDSQ